MPSGISTLSAFIQSGDPDKLAVALPAPVSTGAAAFAPGDFSNYAPGQLGRGFWVNDRVYAPVKLDSGATSATPTGSVLANQVLFWKDKVNRIVTNDSRFTPGGATANAFRNFAAGIARIAVPTPGAGGTLIAALQKGLSIPVVSDGNGSPGDYAVVASSTTLAEVTNSAAGTAPPFETVGVITAAASGGNITVDVDIPELP